MRKSKLSQAKEISIETKYEVLERQHWRSISGVAITKDNVSFHHVISRGNGGIGLAFNIVAITPNEHRWYHDHADIMVNGRKRYTWIEFDILMKNHLKLKYPYWNENACKYHKMWDVKDYWNEIKIEREK